MAILAYVETSNNTINKGGFELATYTKKAADIFGTECHALILGPCDNINDLSTYGLDGIHHCKDDNLKSFDTQTYTRAIATATKLTNADTVILRHSSKGKSLMGRLSVRLKAGSVSGVNALPSSEKGFSVTKGVYSGKAYAEYQINTDKRVISLMGNTMQPETLGSNTEISDISLGVENGKTTILEVKTETGQVPLPEAELVVSAGRGMKGPENWGIIEDLADVLGATTACSRPVADVGWRPHHEHVGQTGVAIRPNLYIAVGISGAIQHLAGVNNSKVIVVINKDPEAPFFKAADYGVIGDLFEVVPKLSEALKQYKTNS
jgi:electron transfer flavoprotein alpha subunit